MDKSKPCTLIAALKDFFGYLPGQNLSMFSAEVKALNDDERAYFTKALREQGYQIN